MSVQRTRNQFPSSSSKFVSLESGHDRSNVSILQLRKASPSPGPNGTVVLPRSSEPSPYLHFHASFTLFPSLVIFIVPPLGFDNSRYSLKILLGKDPVALRLACRATGFNH